MAQKHLVLCSTTNIQNTNSNWYSELFGTSTPRLKMRLEIKCDWKLIVGEGAVTNLKKMSHA